MLSKEELIAIMVVFIKAMVNVDTWQMNEVRHIWRFYVDSLDIS